MRIALLCAGYLILVGCISGGGAHEPNQTLSQNISQDTTIRVETILDPAVMFVERNETIALNSGRPLTTEEIQYAKKLGVQNPERVRVEYRWNFPKPNDPTLSAELGELGFGSVFEGGRATGYGIFVKPYMFDKDMIIRHELVHVLQMERLGVAAFVKQYLEEAMTYEYHSMPLEREAFEATADKR